MESLSKIFVGNVPFQCAKEEFIECFKNYDGFVDGDIVFRPSGNGPNISRGFGFICFKTDTHANNFMIGKHQIIFKNRILRFTKYIPNTSTVTHSTNNKTNELKNLLYVKNIPLNLQYIDLKNMFTIYGEVGIVFINKGNNSGIVEIKNKDIYEQLLNMKTIDHNGTKIELDKLKHKKPKYNVSNI